MALSSLPTAVAFCAFSAAAASLPLPAIRLRQEPGGEKSFVDEEGREVVFHGVNAIVKGPPWVPALDEFSTDISMTDADFEIMEKFGLNVIRLGVMWPGVEPERGQYNDTYIALLREIADRAANYGIYTLLDMHQDVLADAFCGEGLPLWAHPTMQPGFPFPVGRPFLETDELGLPTRQACAEHNWPSYYMSRAVAKAYQDLYTNEDGLLDSWAAMWAHVAEKFKGATHVLGIELINEPYAGDFYRKPAIMIPFGPGTADRVNLLPAYDKVAEKIRAVDPEQLIFFAGITWDDAGAQFPRVPGGNEFQNTSVLAYHYYAPPQLSPSTPLGARVQFEAQLEEARRLGSALMLTEFCGPACNDFPTKNFDGVADAADAYRQSYATWEWKTFCREDASTINSTSQWAAYGSCRTGYGSPWNGALPANSPRYARTYARAVAGNVTSLVYNATTGDFAMRFKLDTRVQGPTEIFAHKEFHYSKGFKLKVTPEGVVDAQYNETTGLLHIMPTADARHGHDLTVQITNNAQ